MNLSVTSKQKMDGVYMLSAAGRLDTNTYPELESRVDVGLREKPHTIVFDMERLDYISSMGVRVIAKTQKAMKAYNGKVVLLNLQPQIQKVFESYCLSQHFYLYRQEYHIFCAAYRSSDGSHHTILQ